MTYLLDTTVLIDFSREKEQAVDLLRSIPDASISIVTAYELVQGARNKTELNQIHQALSKLTIHPITPDISETALELLFHFTLSHGLLILDALIAATALAHHLTLVTANTKHFTYIPSLKLKTS